MMLDSQLASRSLTLRSLRPDEVDGRYVGWLNDPEINRYLESRFVRHDLDGVRAFVRDCNESSHSLLLGIFVGEIHVGNIKLGPISAEHGRGDIGLLVGERDYWGRGLATEAIRLLTAHAHDALGLMKVTAGLYADNEGSRRAFEKCGYVQEARLKDHWAVPGGRMDQLLFAHFKTGRAQ